MVGLRQDHGHAVMELPDNAHGLVGENGQGAENGAVWTGPVLEDPGHDHDAAVFRCQKVRRLVPRVVMLPFVEALGGDQAASIADGGPEGRLVKNGFDPGVDALGSDLWILGPEWDKPPAKKSRHPTCDMPVGRDRFHELGWSNVIAIGDLRESGKANILGNEASGNGKSESTAHAARIGARWTGGKAAACSHL